MPYGPGAVRLFYGKEAARRQKMKEHEGFTIVELMVVIVIIGILVAVIVPAVTGAIDKAELAADNAFVAEINSCLALYSVTRDMPVTSPEIHDILETYGMTKIEAQSEDRVIAFDRKLRTAKLADLKEIEKYSSGKVKVSAEEGVEITKNIYMEPEYLYGDLYLLENTGKHAELVNKYRKAFASFVCDGMSDREREFFSKALIVTEEAVFPACTDTDVNEMTEVIFVFNEDIQTGKSLEEYKLGEKVQKVYIPVLFNRIIEYFKKTEGKLFGGSENIKNLEIYIPESEYKEVLFSNGITENTTVIYDETPLGNRLEIAVEGEGRVYLGGKAENTGVFIAGTEVLLTAEPLEHSVFSCWKKGDTIISEEAEFYIEMPEEDTVITAVFETELFTLTIVNGNGTQEYKYCGGAEVGLTADEKDGYIFSGWYNEEGELLSADRTFLFIMPYRDTSVNAQYEAETVYHIITVIAENAEVTVQNADYNGSFYKVEAGKEITVNVSPYEGYVFKSMEIDGEMIEYDHYTFVPEKDLTITVNVAEASYIYNLVFISSGNTEERWKLVFDESRSIYTAEFDGDYILSNSPLYVEKSDQSGKVVEYYGDGNVSVKSEEKANIKEAFILNGQFSYKISFDPEGDSEYSFYYLELTNNICFSCTRGSGTSCRCNEAKEKDTYFYDMADRAGNKVYAVDGTGNGYEMSRIGNSVMYVLTSDKINYSLLKGIKVTGETHSEELSEVLVSGAKKRIAFRYISAAGEVCCLNNTAEYFNKLEKLDRLILAFG